MPPTTCAKALQLWQEKHEDANPEEAEVIKLMCLIPPIEKLDSALNTLVNVKHLSLSTNCIDKMIPLPGLKNLQILSLGRNQIKKIMCLEEAKKFHKISKNFKKLSSKNQ
ncbi:leucine-rich-repeat protein 7, putative [Perkinsus marinus ATCC 50983]|uniref:Leucine-rich-repeat protein 7, putative n=1 Tax=Perkinsus marinus (strain ATCC 50983 / TXsc) TaxID=423536 RepID=C5LC72_PERM5|nr:leucine-rich-repeat protein 7, putative [Perkinsus marinus ATCC 50983]EER05555.1 leucine-rich-repeat protein 7, putative [Perkinsus marinus ATCC 50983]|eukprot:XP_002773739.1 leucine-rich-repeat protein 7, putative [Perkinsus marinus ATCC 50983]